MHSAFGPGLQRLLLQGLWPTGHISSAAATRPGRICAFAVMVSTLVQQWPKVIFKLFIATLASDHICASLLCRDEHLWNLSVLQIVHLSILSRTYTRIPLFHRLSDEAFSFLWLCNVERQNGCEWWIGKELSIFRYATTIPIFASGDFGEPRYTSE
jgi:hypothetical protein